MTTIKKNLVRIWATAVAVLLPACAQPRIPVDSVDPNTSEPVVETLSVPRIFPADNPWNTDVSSYPVHPNSASFIASMGFDVGLHPDFGTEYEGAPIGIPYVLVHGDQAAVPITFEYQDESDPGPYPIPPDFPIEGGSSSTGDRHVIVIDVDQLKLYEVYNAFPLQNGASWHGDSGAVWNLTSNASRPEYWTSADAAGLPIFAGLVRYDEVVEKQAINHALRFTVVKSQRAFIPPASHWASSSTDPNLPPMGLRVRLKASFDETPFPQNIRVILRAMKRYGMLLADNGSNWYVSGAPDPRWNDDELRLLSQVRGHDFEVIYTGDPITH